MDKQRLKNIWSSRTVWLAIFQAISGLVLALTTTDPALKDIAGLMILKSLADLGLRALTNKPLNL